MLLAVEGGGFFSSSASGYSKGLTLLLLGQKNEEKPMRVTPWNQYQLVDQATEPDIPLASEKNRLVCGCTAFACFGRAAAELETPCSLKVGPTQNQEVLPEPIVIESKEETHPVDPVDDIDSNKKIISLKSSLKKSASNAAVADPGGGGGGDGQGNNSEHQSMCEKKDVNACQRERREVQWTDVSGGELFEIREFEMSEDGSEDEFNHGNEKTCSCTIM